MVRKSRTGLIQLKRSVVTIVGKNNSSCVKSDHESGKRKVIFIAERWVWDCINCKSFIPINVKFKKYHVIEIPL